MTAFAINIYAKMQTLRARRDGATAIEYSLIAALIALGIITGVTLIGSTLSTTFNTVGSALN